MERQHYFFDGFRAVGQVSHASPEVGHELGVKRQEVQANSRLALRRALAPSSGSSSRARLWLGGSAHWSQCSLARRQGRRAAWRVAVNTPSQPAVCSGAGRGSRQLARTGYQLLGASDSFCTDVLGVRPCTSVPCRAATTDDAVEISRVCTAPLRRIYVTAHRSVVRSRRPAMRINCCKEPLHSASPRKRTSPALCGSIL